ncbi:1-acyl-sn-glycerol-3-phosphate acyltransferase [Saccharicrinis sp. FJH2]|uniref:1-acyl-sn-glycerol-3-phosphate acyltransferase n=1 Tax=Saccharicrinis sp. FJH65 TaxID=3344659 RepID=UPI0035F27C4D
MIEARHHKQYEHFFKWYLNRILKKNFHQVKYLDCGYNRQSAPTLAIGNHFSWWDGFWMLELNRKKLKKKFHILMLDEQLKPRMFLNKLGAAGITKNSRDIITMLEYCSKLMHDPKNILFFFPEGEIRPQNQNKLHFEKGIMRIIERAPDNLQLMFVVNLTEYFSNKKPTLFSFYKSIEAKPFSDIRAMEDAYNSFLAECKNQLKLYNV